MKGFWTCQRVDHGSKCRHLNPNRQSRCSRCGKRRPARKSPAHLSALKLPYEYYVQINGGEHCGVCGKRPGATRKLDKDHEHVGVGRPRGLLCWRHNKALEMFSDDPVLLRAAADYLERAGPYHSPAGLHESTG